MDEKRSNARIKRRAPADEITRGERPGSFPFIVLLFTNIECFMLGAG